MPCISKQLVNIQGKGGIDNRASVFKKPYNRERPVSQLSKGEVSTNEAPMWGAYNLLGPGSPEFPVKYH